MPKIVCDSSTLVSLADTCNIGAVEFLNQKEKADFIIPPGVEEEIIAVPSRIKSLAFSSLRIRKLVEDGSIRVEGNPALAQKTHEILDLANRLYRLGSRPLQVLHRGEAECLALMCLTGAKILAVDEKTTRLIIEDPIKLQEMMAGEYAEKLLFDLPTHEALRGLLPEVAIIRSAELLALAAKSGFFSQYGNHEEEAFHASIYSLRAAGCSLAMDEMQQYEQISL